MICVEGKSRPTPTPLQQNHHPMRGAWFSVMPPFSMESITAPQQPHKPTNTVLHVCSLGGDAKRVVACWAASKLNHATLSCTLPRRAIRYGTPMASGAGGQTSLLSQKDLLDGNAVVVFAYGLSGSGKTYTVWPCRTAIRHTSHSHR